MKLVPRYYLNCEDIFSAIKFLLINPETESIAKSPRDSGIYHITGTDKFNNLELAQLIHEEICAYYHDSTIPFNYELVDYHSARPAHDFRYQMSGEKLKRLGWIAKGEIRESIKNTVIWYLEHINYL